MISLHTLRKKLSSDRHKDRIWAVHRLSEIPNPSPEVIELLIAASQDRLHAVKICALRRLAELTDPAVIEPLVKAYFEPNAEIRDIVKKGIENFRDMPDTVKEKAFVLFENILRSPANYTCREVIFAMYLAGVLRIKSAVPLLIKFLEHPDSNLVKTAIEILGKIGDKTAFQHIIPFVDKYPFVAGEALRKIDADQAFSIMRACFETAPESQKSAIIDVLKNFPPTPEVIAFLVEKLPSVKVSLQIDILQKVAANDTAVPLLVRLIKETTDKWLKNRVLLFLRSPSAADALIEIINDKNEDPGVRSHAVFAIARIKDPRAGAVFLQNLDMPAVKCILDGYDPSKKEMLIGIKDTLIQMLDDPAMSEIAAGALANIDEPDVIQALLKVINFPDKYPADTVDAAIKSLGFLKAREAVPRLCELAKNEKNKSAIFALGKIGDPFAVDTLVQLLPQEDCPLSDVIDALCGIRHPDAVAGVITALNYVRDTDQLNAILLFLNENPDPRCIDPLLEIYIKDVSQLLIVDVLKKLQNTAVEKIFAKIDSLKGKKFESTISVLTTLLVRIVDFSTVPLLCGALRHNNPVIRRTAAKLLGYLRDPLATNALCEALFDPDAETSRNAAEALGTINDPRAVDALCRAVLTLPGNALAAWALAEIGDPRAVPVLLAALEHPSINSPETIDAIISALVDSGDIRALPVFLKHDCENDPILESKYIRGVFNILRQNPTTFLKQIFMVDPLYIPLLKRFLSDPAVLLDPQEPIYAHIAHITSKILGILQVKDSPAPSFSDILQEHNSILQELRQIHKKEVPPQVKNAVQYLISFTKTHLLKEILTRQIPLQEVLQNSEICEILKGADTVIVREFLERVLADDNAEIRAVGASLLATVPYDTSFANLFQKACRDIDPVKKNALESLRILLQKYKLKEPSPFYDFPHLAVKILLELTRDSPEIRKKVFAILEASFSKFATYDIPQIHSLMQFFRNSPEKDIADMANRILEKISSVKV